MTFSFNLGYPPADHEARGFLTADDSRKHVSLRMRAFMEALFEHTAEVIRKEFPGADYEELAMGFRSKMTKGQTFQSVNPFRRKFYHDVVLKAERKFTDAKACHAYFALIKLTAVAGTFRIVE